MHAARLVPIVAGCIVVAVLSPSVRADVVYVDADATGPGEDGLSWCTAYRDLQDGLAVAMPGDEVRVANGVYTPDGGSGSRSATFDLRSQVTYLGGYAGCGAADPDARNTVTLPSVLSGDLLGNDGSDFAIYGDNSYHIVTYRDPNATGTVLDGFTVRGGNADGAAGGTSNQGGGIHIRNGSAKCMPGGPTIRDCIVEWNRGQHHGAINDHGLSTVIENCTIRNNYVGVEGGGLQIHSGSPQVTGCLFENNTSDGEGGGAWAGTDTDSTCTGPSRPEFRDCIFDGNKAPKGGGLFIDGSGPSVTRCTFRNNTTFFSQTTPNTGFAGGVYNFQGVDVTFTDCLFTANDTALYAGAMYNEGSSPHILRVRFIGNVLSLEGLPSLAGAMLNVLGSHPRVEDCIFRDNVAL